MKNESYKRRLANRERIEGEIGRQTINNAYGETTRVGTPKWATYRLTLCALERKQDVTTEWSADIKELIIFWVFLSGARWRRGWRRSIFER